MQHAACCGALWCAVVCCAAVYAPPPGCVSRRPVLSAGILASHPSSLALAVDEVGDGNINFVYILSGPSGQLCLKQALPFVRCVGEGWPLTQVRPPLAGSVAARVHAGCCAPLLQTAHKPPQLPMRCRQWSCAAWSAAWVAHWFCSAVAIAGSCAHRGGGAGGGGGPLPAARAGSLPLRRTHVHYCHAGKAAGWVFMDLWHGCALSGMCSLSQSCHSAEQAGHARCLVLLVQPL